MAITGQDFCSANTSSERESGPSRLIPTGRKITSITSTVDIFEDSKGSLFFGKGIKDGGKELGQLLYLDSIGITVPEKVLVNPELTQMATPSAGTPLSEIAKELGPRNQNAMYRQAGVILNAIHERVGIVPPPDELLSASYQSTAHTVDNFYFKHHALVTDQEYGAYKKARAAGQSPDMLAPGQSEIVQDRPFIPIGEGPAHLRTLLTFANDLAGSYLNRLNPHVRLAETASGVAKPFLDIPDKEVFEGDYKQDNLLVKETPDSLKLTVIDPVLSRGSRHFDLAKFASRYLLETKNYEFGNNLDHFFDGYENRPAPDKQVYGGLSFTDLMQMDILIILRSYAKRFYAGDTQYRLVGALGRAEFCQQTAGIMATLEDGKLIK